LQHFFYFIILLSPAGAVAKYCNERVCVCVCLSVTVCLSVRERISRTTRAISSNFCACCLSPWLGPPLAGWRNPKGKGQFWGFLPIVQHSIWDPYKNGWSDQDAVWVNDSGGPGYHMLYGRPDP